MLISLLFFIPLLAMKKLYNLFAAVFFLFLFLFPQIEKGIHDLIHADDFHCNEKSTSHFHIEEHHCSTCEYSLPLVYKKAIAGFVFILPVYFSSYIELKSTHLLDNLIAYSSPRAPPSFPL